MPFPPQTHSIDEDGPIVSFPTNITAFIRQGYQRQEEIINC